MDAGEQVPDALFSSRRGCSLAPPRGDRDYRHGVSPCLVQRNFERRKVALGTCGRSYATGCIHEHSCLRCPLLRPDPAGRHRIEEIRDNLRARIDEARREGWLGELDGLQISLAGARQKLAQLDQLAAHRDTVTLGMPSFSNIVGRTNQTTTNL